MSKEESKEGDDPVNEIELQNEYAIILKSV